LPPNSFLAELLAEAALPTVIIKEDPDSPERLGGELGHYCLQVTRQSGHARLPGDWKKPTPFEWSGFDDDGSKMLILVSPTWSTSELHDFALDRWHSLVTSLRERLAREQRSTNARHGGKGKGQRISDAAKERGEKIRDLHRKLVRDGTAGHLIAGKIAIRLNITSATVRAHLKKPAK
jgi:hypothetical protein